MKADEKRCPDCAETIKLDAAKCRHCGKTFSKRDIVLSKYRDRASPQERDIDKAISKAWEQTDDYIYTSDISRRVPVSEDKIQKVLVYSNLNREEVVSRLLRLGFSIKEGQQPTSDEEIDRLRAEWKQERERALSGDLSLGFVFKAMRLTGHTLYTSDMAEALSSRLRIPRKQFDAAAKEHGLQYIGINDGSIKWRRDLIEYVGPLVVKDSPRPNYAPSPSRDAQYGVLQPAANLAAGCLNLWGIVLLVFIIALVFTAVKLIFTGE